MNLTINEQLMIDTKDANICIFVANLAGWIRTNARKDTPNQRNIHEGRCWSYNSIQEFVRYFGFWSTKNIRTIIANCIKLDLITTSTFNKKKYDNTLWYSLTDKGLDYYPHVRDLVLDRLADSGKTLADSGKPIPELPYQSSINTTNSSKPKGNELIKELIQVYREEFPNNPQPHPKVISTSLEKVLRGLIKRWPEAAPDSTPISTQAFRNYLQYLKSNCPQFALGEWENANGKRKKNGLETFARWNTFVKCLEGAYS